MVGTAQDDQRLRSRRHSAKSCGASSRSSSPAISSLPRPGGVNVGFAKLQMAGDLQCPATRSTDSVPASSSSAISVRAAEQPDPRPCRRAVLAGAHRRSPGAWPRPPSACSPTPFLGAGLRRVRARRTRTDLLMCCASSRHGGSGLCPGRGFVLPHAWFRRAARPGRGFVSSRFPLAKRARSPLSGAILTVHGWCARRLRGWQWLFLVEALPSLAIGIVDMGDLCPKVRAQRAG